MTNAQFEALGKLVGSRTVQSRAMTSASTIAARLVLVEGMKKSDTATACGINKSTVTRIVQTYVETLELAKIVAGM